MSTSMQQVGVAPLSAPCYPPPPWLVREIETRSWLRRSAKFPGSRHSARLGRFTTLTYSENRRELLRDLRRGNMRVKTSACVLGAIAWIFIVVTAVARLDSSNFAEWRDSHIVALTPKPSLTERLEAATSSIREVSRRILMPAVVATDSTGTIDNALPLFVKVTNLAPNTEIILTGLAAGTTLTSGSSVGVREWRINIVDLPYTQVVPPQGYSGLMTLVAELRDQEGHPLSRAPVHLTWNVAAEPPSENDINEGSAGVVPVNTLASASDPQDQRLIGQPVERQSENVALPKPRPIKRIASATKHSKPKKQLTMAQGYKHRMARRDPGADARWAPDQLPSYSLVADPRSERQANLEQIFRGLFDSGRHNCGPARSTQTSQRQLRDGCDGMR